MVLGMSFSVAQDSKPELRTWTAVNGKEVEAEFVSNEKGIVKLKLKTGKVFEVPANKLSKEDNEFISSLDKPEGVSNKETEIRNDGILYLKGLDLPYSGKTFRLHINGQKWFANNYKDGKKEGLQTWWYENGQKWSEGNRKDGKQDGLWTEWHENGQKRAEANYKDGKRDGLYLVWHENGQKWSEGNWKDGKQEGLEVTWHENGQKDSKVTYKDGEEVEGSEKRWNEKGELRER